MTGPRDRQRENGACANNGGVRAHSGVSSTSVASSTPAKSPNPAKSTGSAKSPGPAKKSGRSTNGYDVRLYGALDLGTNNCRLLVARPSRRGFLVIDAFSRIIRLGEGVSRSGVLSEAAMGRTIEALKVCSDKLTSRGVHRTRLIATEACRIAANSAEFIERVRLETGLEIEIVSRETEARLAVSGCASLIDHSCDWALVFDIGGGSSELIWLDLTRLRHTGRQKQHDRIGVQSCIKAWTSLPVGVVTLSERFGGRSVGLDDFEKMVQYVYAKLEEFEHAHKISGHISGGTAHFLGTSGTVTTIAGVHLGLNTYNRSKVDGCWLDVGEVRAVSETLLTMSFDERARQPCIGTERADLVLAGCAILEAMLRVWPCNRLRVADRGLREGILATLMAEDSANLPRRHKSRRRNRRGGYPKSLSANK